MEKGPSQRLRSQLRHLGDMIKEQNRMQLAEVEPTSAEREDMAQLVENVKRTAESEGRTAVNAIKSTYDEHLESLRALGYSVGNYGLVAPPSQPPPQSSPTKNSATKSKPAKNKQTKSKSKREDRNEQSGAKHVRFEEAGADPLSTPFRDDASDELNMAYGSEPGGFRDAPSDEASDDSDADEPLQSQSQTYEQNELLLADQDRRLDQIGRSVGRQRAMGVDINTELDHQNTLLDDLEAQVDHTGGRLDRLTDGVRTFNRKSRECGVCSTIMLLVLILFIVIII